MITPLQGHIATRDLKKPLNQLRGFQQETEIVLRKTTHAYNKGDEEGDGPLAPFAMNSTVMDIDRHDPDYVRFCQDDFTMWSSLEVPSEDTVYN